MQIKAIEKNYNIKVRSGDILINKMQSRIKRFEKKYGISSKEMLDRVRQDPKRETEEIGHWMQNYTVVERIANGINTTGIRSKTIDKSRTTV